MSEKYGFYCENLGRWSMMGPPDEKELAAGVQWFEVVELRDVGFREFKLNFNSPLSYILLEPTATPQPVLSIRGEPVKASPFNDQMLVVLVVELDLSSDRTRIVPVESPASKGHKVYIPVEKRDVPFSIRTGLK